MSAVYKAIAAVQGELAKVGIAKNRRNQQGSGYNFRGIDDVYAALSPLLAAHGLVVIPRVIERDQVERASQRGGALFYTTVKAEFDFVAVEDGSKHTASTYGEAMDSGDKSTNKAMSAAYKYAAFMTFAIPTEGDNDADETTHEVAPKAGAKAEPQRKAKPSGHITPQQLDQMKALIPSQKTLTEAIIMGGWNVSDLTELTAEQADKTIARLKAECRKANPQHDEELADSLPY